ERYRRCRETRAQGEAPRLPHALRLTRSSFWPTVSLIRKCRPDAHVAETRRGSSVTCAHGLHGLAFSAIGRAPEGPVAELADGVAGIPELRGDSAVAGILEHADFLAAFDLPADFGGKLKLVAAVINGPGTICLHEDSVGSVGDEVVIVPRAGKEADVGHANDGQAVPTFRAHCS